MTLSMKVGEWVLVNYEWNNHTTVTAEYERKVGTCGKATFKVSCLPHQAPSIVLELLTEEKK